MKSKYIIMLSLLSLIACEVVVDVEVPEPPELLVVNCLFDSNGKWKANISKNKYILDNDVYVFFNDAIIMIIRPDESRFVMDGPFFPDDNQIGFYYTFADNEPVVYDQPYIIQVEKEGFPNAFSTSIIPSPAKIEAYKMDTSSYSYYGQDNAPISQHLFERELSVTFTDAPGVNYYALRLKIERVYEYYNDNIQAADIDTVLYYAGLETDDPIVEEFMSNSGELLFSDKTFPNQTYNFKAKYHAYMLENAISLTIELHTVTEAYYLYRFTQRQQDWIDGDPFAEPAQVQTNIENGYGIFAGTGKDSVNITF
jgi:hypothetical protein